jgi:hypothetical protein
MNKKTLRRKRKIKRVEEIKRNYSRKFSTLRKIVPHRTRMKTVVAIQKEYSSWQ